MRIHNRQFVISRTMVKVPEDWLSEPFRSGYLLSYCPFARVSRCHDADGSLWLLIGNASSCAQDLESPESIIARLSTSDVREASSFWAGRWCLAGEELILTDATNLIGLVYDDSREIIASSVSLLNELLTGRLELPNELLKEGYYHNWYLLPLTGYAGIRKLLPQQIFTLQLPKSTRWEIKYRAYHQDYSKQSYETTYEALKDSLENEMRFLAEKKNAHLHIALSGGYDSRLILALAMTVGCEFSCYTHVFATMKLSDYSIPPQISTHHRYIAAKKEDNQRKQRFDLQNGLHARDMDRLLFSRGQWDGFETDDYCIRGGVLELAGHSSAHLYDRVVELGFEDIDARLFNYALKDYRHFQIDSLTELFRVQQKHPLTGFDFHKNYYLNQRIAGWLSYIETGLDLIKGTSYHLGNSIYQINLMNSLPERVKKVKGFHLDYIYRNQPGLLTQPFNTASLADKVKSFTNSKLGRFIFK